jgi:hypothetical protein
MMNRKACGRKWVLEYFKVYYQTLPGRAEIETKSQNQNFNPGPPEYEAGMLATRPSLLHVRK